MKKDNELDNILSVADQGIGESAHCINWFSDFFMANWRGVFQQQQKQQTGTTTGIK